MPKSRGKSSKAQTVQSSMGPSARAAARLLSGTRSAGVPPFHLAQLIYPVAFTSSSTTSNQWDWQFRLNSLFDPDFTGTGSQPTTFDQWMTLYDRYRVIACDVDLTLSASDGVTPIVAAFAPGQDAAPTLTYAGIAGDRDVCLGKSQYMAMSHMHKTFLMKDVFGVDEEAVMSELSYSGSSSANPAAVAYGTLCAFTAGATTAVMLTGFLRFAVRFENAHMNNVSLVARTVQKPLTPGELLSTVTPATPLLLSAQQAPPKSLKEELAEERALLEREARAVRARLQTIQSEQLQLVRKPADPNASF